MNYIIDMSAVHTNDSQ